MSIRSSESYREPVTGSEWFGRTVPKPAEPPKPKATRGPVLVHLKPIETSDRVHGCNEGDCDPYSPPEYLPEPGHGAKYRHRSWAAERGRIYHALHSAGASPSRLASFASCGEDAWLGRRAGQDGWKFICNHCHDRFCQKCAAERAKKLRFATEGIIAGRPLTFITLTLRSGDDEGLSLTVDRILGSFKTLRKMPVWMAAVFGGVAFLETKWKAATSGSAAGRWHTHLHILADAEYIDQRSLSEAWHACTGDSFIVDIRRVKSELHALRYVTKYAAKGVNTEEIADEPHLIEAILALKGRRLALCFGSWYGKSLEKAATESLDQEPTEFEKLVPLWQAIDWARKGEEKWAEILREVGIWKTDTGKGGGG